MTFNRAILTAIGLAFVGLAWSLVSLWRDRRRFNLELWREWRERP